MSLKAVTTQCEVCEGAGCAVTRENVHKTAPQTVFFDRQRPSGVTVLDVHDALQQLERALRVSEPAVLLRTCSSGSTMAATDYITPETEARKGVTCASRASAHRRLCVEAMHGECIALQNWLSRVAAMTGGHTQLTGHTAEHLIAPLLLRNKSYLRELLQRARSVAHEALEWETTRDLFVSELSTTHAFERHVAPDMYACGTLRAMTELVADLVLDLRQIVDDLTTLLPRYRALAPAIEEAVLRARVVQEVRHSASNAFQQGLQSLNDTLKHCRRDVAEDVSQARTNVTALRTRYEALARSWTSASHCA